jgi:hypothetical protein
MSSELWKYAKLLGESGDLDSEPVRGVVQKFETNALFQNVVGHINRLHEVQQLRVEGGSAKKSGGKSARK